MDMMTLALAKKYTDEKVGSGGSGGSGGGSGLLVVEINTPFGAEPAMLTEAENAKMNEAEAQGMPIILKISDGSMGYVFVANIMADAESGMIMGFVGMVHDSTFMVASDGTGAWALMKFG